MKIITFFGSLALVFGCMVVARPAAATTEPDNLLWFESHGTSEQEESLDVSADGLGNVYISGYTRGNLGGTFAGGLDDAFVSKYDDSGTLLWTVQQGTSSRDLAFGVSADGLGNVYSTGRTGSSAFISKYDANGSFLWTDQLGTNISALSHGVSADGLGNAYISGFTSGSLGGTNAGFADAFVSKYDDAGSLLWTRQLGTSGSDESRGVSADGLGNVYISGRTNGSLDGSNAGGFDAFVSKYDDAGSLQWTRQLGTSDSDRSQGVSADGLGNVYITGFTFGNLGGPNAGQSDVYVSKFDAAGSLIWTTQFGTSGGDEGRSVSADELGNVYITGSTRNSVFVSKLDASGSLQWTMHPNRGAFLSYGVSADGLGNVYASGGARIMNDGEAFLVKYGPGVMIPEPATCTLVLAALCLPLRRSR